MRLCHSVSERLRFIDGRLFWDARINRSDLIKEFSVSPAQAASDFREYLALSPKGVQYDTRAKAYIAVSEFEPVFGLPDARAGLQKLLDKGDPIVSELKRLERPLNPTVASEIRRNAKEHHKIQVFYQSFTQPDPSWRWIAPSRLVSDGQRWHVRAWCYRHGNWKDFVLARILELRQTEPAGELPIDVDWIEMQTVVLVPADHLSPGQKASVMREFAMQDGRLVVDIPRAMKIYAVHQWGLNRPDSRLRELSASTTLLQK